MLYRDSWDADPALCEDERYQNIALKQPTILGPWFVMSLWTVLVLFLLYVVYSHWLVSIRPGFSPKHVLRLPIDTTIGPHTPADERDNPQQLHHSGVAGTTVPHSRADNALLGGQGPALLPGSGTVPLRGTTETSLNVAVVPR